MANADQILALDLSLTTGWAYGGLRDMAPRFGRWHLNGGLKDMAQSWVDLQNRLEDFLTVSPTALVVMALPYAKMQTTARLGLGFAAHAESSCWRKEIRCREIPEGTARKGVLGRGHFAARDDQKRVIKGSARKLAKAAAMEWCHGKGWKVRDDNEADACVIWEYARRLTLARAQWDEPV